jgi:hypothetical protein
MDDPEPKDDDGRGGDGPTVRSASSSAPVAAATAKSPTDPTDHDPFVDEKGTFAAPSKRPRRGHQKGRNDFGCCGVARVFRLWASNILNPNDFCYHADGRQQDENLLPNADHGTPSQNPTATVTLATSTAIDSVPSKRVAYVNHQPLSPFKSRLPPYQDGESPPPRGTLIGSAWTLEDLAARFRRLRVSSPSLTASGRTGGSGKNLEAAAAPFTAAAVASTATNSVSQADSRGVPSTSEAPPPPGLKAQQGHHDARHAAALCGNPGFAKKAVGPDDDHQPPPEIIQGSVVDHPEPIAPDSQMDHNMHHQESLFFLYNSLHNIERSS